MGALTLATKFVETTPIPDPLVRLGIAALCGRTHRKLSSQGNAANRSFATAIAGLPIAEHVDDANAQHYEVPAAFFDLVLGPQRKYSCCLFRSRADGLAVAEESHVDSTRRAARIGIDLIECHIAHGYFLHEFLSPLSNKRTDKYGGSLENRMRYPLEVFAAMRAVWPSDRPMGVRHSVTDWAEGGWTPHEAEVFAGELKKLGCDYMTATTGGLSVHQKIPIGEGHQVEFARLLRGKTGMPTIAVGMIFDPHHAERILQDGDADFIALARGVLSDPHWPWRAAATLDAEVEYPVQYVRGYKSNWLRSMRAVGAREVTS